MSDRGIDASSGFTLIEIIVTFVALAIMASMMAAYFGTAIWQSAAPIARLNATARLNRVLEKITAQYAGIPHWRPDTAYSANTVILPTTPIRNGYQYIANAGGQSGSSEPGWRIDGTTTSDNGVTWTLNGAAPTLVDLQTSIGDSGGGENRDYTNTYGSYRVIQNRFIKFDSSGREVDINSSPNEDAFGRFLKVTIGFRSDAADRTGETRTALFVMR